MYYIVRMLVKAFLKERSTWRLKTKGIFFKCTFKSLCRLFGTIEVTVAKKEYGVGMILSAYFKAEMECSLTLFFDGDVSFFVAVPFTLA